MFHSVQEAAAVFFASSYTSLRGTCRSFAILPAFLVFRGHGDDAAAPGKDLHRDIAEAGRYRAHLPVKDRPLKPARADAGGGGLREEDFASGPRAAPPGPAP